MGRRQQRIDVYHTSIVWSDYLEKEMQVICTNGAVYRGTLQKVNGQKIRIKDESGEHVDLGIETIKEIILDFITEY